MDRVERMDRLRRRMLVGFLVTYVAWQAPTILQDALGASVAPAVTSGLRWIAALAGLVWIFHGARLARLMRRIGADPELAEALQDERVVQWRDRAQIFAFWALVAYLAVVRLGAFFAHVPAGVVAQAGLLLAVVTAIGCFLVLDRE